MAEILPKEKSFTDELYAELTEYKPFLPEYAAALYELYAQGGGDMEAKSHLLLAMGVKAITLRWEEWLKEASFREFLKDCHALSFAWWERQARNNLQSQHFKVQLWASVMRNRFGYEDLKSSFAQTGQITVIERKIIDVSPEK